MDELDDNERAQIQDAVMVVRRHRAAHGVPPRDAHRPGWPSPPPRPPSLRKPPRGHHRAASPGYATPTGQRAQAMLYSRHTGTTRRRQRVITAMERSRSQGTKISVSGIGRVSAVDRSFLCRHHDRLEAGYALAGKPPAAAQASPVVTRA